MGELKSWLIRNGPPYLLMAALAFLCVALAFPLWLIAVTGLIGLMLGLYWSEIRHGPLWGGSR